MHYLCIPPPVAGMHLIVDTFRLLFISILALRSKRQVRCKLRIAVQRAHTVEDVTSIKIKCFTSYRDLFMLELWLARKRLVDDLIQVIRIPVR